LGAEFGTSGAIQLDPTLSLITNTGRETRAGWVAEITVAPQVVMVVVEVVAVVEIAVGVGVTGFAGESTLASGS
jgi:hypothetical protein